MPSEAQPQDPIESKNLNTVARYNVSNDMTKYKVTSSENFLEFHGRNSIVLTRAVNAAADFSSTISALKVNIFATGYFLDKKFGISATNTRSYASLTTNDNISVKKATDDSKFLDTKVIAEIRTIENVYKDRAKTTTIIHNTDINLRAFMSNGRLNERTITRTNGLSRATLEDPPPLQITCLDLAAHDEKHFEVNSEDSDGHNHFDLPLSHQVAGQAESADQVFDKIPRNYTKSGDADPEKEYYLTRDGAQWYDFPSLGDIERYAGKQIRETIENSKEYARTRFFLRHMRAWVSSMNRGIPKSDNKVITHISGITKNPLSLDNANITNSTVQIEIPRGMRQTFRFAASFGRTYNMGQTTNIYTTDTRVIYLASFAQTIEEQTVLVNAASTKHYLCMPKLPEAADMEKIIDTAPFTSATSAHNKHEINLNGMLKELEQTKIELTNLQDRRKKLLEHNGSVMTIQNEINTKIQFIKDMARRIANASEVYKVDSKNMAMYEMLAEESSKNLIDAKVRQGEKSQAIYRYEGDLLIEQVKSDGLAITDTYQSIKFFYPTEKLAALLSITSPNIALLTSKEAKDDSTQVKLCPKSVEIEAQKAFIRALSELTIELKNTKNSIKLSKTSLDLNGEKITLNGDRIHFL